MTNVYVVRNQLGHYWGKKKTWVDGRKAKAVLRARHEDEAINTLFELSSADIELRGEVLAVELNKRDEPVIEPSEFLILNEEDQIDAEGTEAGLAEGKADEQREEPAEGNSATAEQSDVLEHTVEADSKIEQSPADQV